ncbi:hypothetical protein WBG78_16575 [Chryseolinea sp. T2]|uniref:hypothetical protein n=1 Tax=Chryseolinea sp. T2 TaxID=3129255 RepID=UPI003076B377
MAVSKSRKVTSIKFNLNVDAILEGEKVSKISFNMDLNPDKRILAINEYLSSYPGLAAILKDLDRVLGEIERRSQIYNGMVTINPNTEAKWNRKYEENLKPTFGKIDSIDYRHESPGAANVSYVRRYNGDLEPPSL